VQARPGFVKQLRSGVRLLGQGFAASFIGAAPQGALRLATYEQVKSFLLHLPPSNPNSAPVPAWIPQLAPVPASAVAAVCGDLVSSLAKLPREVLTTRLQTTPNASTFQVLRAILYEDGPRGLFRGFVSTTARDVPFMMVLFSTYELLKAEYQGRHGGAIAIPTPVATAFGGLAGGLAGFVTTPMDVVKTRIMTHQGSMSRFGIRQALGTIPNSRSFWVGATARSCWWLGICGIFFPSYEAIKAILV